ncbi:MAG: hypothetical protein QOE63_240 [Acidimicrobiaceae bacterium]
MRRASLVLAGWSIFIWVTRIKNADGDVGVTIYAGALVAVAIVVALLAWKRRPQLRAAARLLAVITGAIWAIRLPSIMLNEHPAGFKVVHAVLGIASFGLAAWVLREDHIQRKREATATTAGLQELADR